eukprot:5499180-Pleurochrysis_carterae.AAC.5
MGPALHWWPEGIVRALEAAVRLRDRRLVCTPSIEEIEGDAIEAHAPAYAERVGMQTAHGGWEGRKEQKERDEKGREGTKRSMGGGKGRERGRVRERGKD